MKILFLYRKKVSFVQTDLDILRSRHEVRELKVDYQFPHILKTISSYIRDTLWADLIFSWFGSHHALLPFLIGKSLGKPRVIVASGFDAARLPEIDYGDMRPGIKRWIGILVYSLASRILAVSEYTQSEIIQNVPVNPSKLTCIYHGFVDPGESNISKKDGVVTIGAVTMNNLRRKGLLAFVKAARYLPEVTFTLVGACQEAALQSLEAVATSNVKILGYVDDINPVLAMTKVYVQPSYHEAFGCSVAEAMLHECIPVVSDRGALPEVVGDTGIIVPFDDLEKIAKGIKDALSANCVEGKKARQRVLENFSIERRKVELFKSIDALMS